MFTPLEERTRGSYLSTRPRRPIATGLSSLAPYQAIINEGVAPPRKEVAKDPYKLNFFHRQTPLLSLAGQYSSAVACPDVPERWLEGRRRRLRSPLGGGCVARWRAFAKVCAEFDGGPSGARARSRRSAFRNEETDGRLQERERSETVGSSRTLNCRKKGMGSTDCVSRIEVKG